MDITKQLVPTNKYGLDLAIGNLWWVPFWQTTAFYVTLGSVLLLLVILFFWYLWSRSKKMQISDPMTQIVYSLNVYKDQLDGVDAQIFYLDLVSKLKTFVGYQCKFDIANKTDAEVKEFINGKQLNNNLVVAFVKILDESYATRFAKGAVSKAVMESDLQKIIIIMQEIINEKLAKK